MFMVLVALCSLLLCIIQIKKGEKCSFWTTLSIYEMVELQARMVCIYGLWSHQLLNTIVSMLEFTAIAND